MSLMNKKESPIASLFPAQLDFNRFLDPKTKDETCFNNEMNRNFNGIGMMIS